jgi:hypothetical protein
MSTGVTGQGASLAIYRRVVYEMARRVGNAPTFPGFGVLRIACLPPPYETRSAMKGHRGGKQTLNHLPSGHIQHQHALCALSWQIV